MELNEAVKNLEIYKTLKKLADKNSLNQSVIFVCDDFVLIDVLIENILTEMFGDGLKIKTKTHPDVFYYPQNGKKSVLVEDVEKIIDESLIKPIEGEKKVFVLKCDELFAAAPQNKLLKTLEEPNKNVFYFLITKNLNLILPTIQSRSLKIAVPKLTQSDFAKLGMSENEFLIYDGNLEKKNNNEAENQTYLACEEVLKQLKSSENLLYCSRVILAKCDAKQVVNCFSVLFRQMMQNKLKNLSHLKEYYEKFSFEAIARILERILQAGEKLKFNCNAKAVIDLLLLGILEEKAKWTKRI